jgi:hypothetical protein
MMSPVMESMSGQRAVEGIVADLVTYLTDEERDYLRRLFAESAARDHPAAGEHTLQLESPSVERSLLLRMLARLRSELVATDGHYCLRFRLEVVPSPYGGPAVLRLLPPTITDRQGVERPARVRPAPGEIGLIDGAGQLLNPRVVDISNSGVALVTEATEPAQPGTRLADLQLKLPGQQPFTVTGRIVRVQRNETHAQKLALEFERIESDAQAALRYYVFDNYDPAS